MTEGMNNGASKTANGTRKRRQQQLKWGGKRSRGNKSRSNKYARMSTFLETGADDSTANGSSDQTKQQVGPGGKLARSNDVLASQWHIATSVGENALL